MPAATIVNIFYAVAGGSSPATPAATTCTGFEFGKNRSAVFAAYSSVNCSVVVTVPSTQNLPAINVTASFTGFTAYSASATLPAVLVHQAAAIVESAWEVTSNSSTYYTGKDSCRTFN